VPINWQDIFSQVGQTAVIVAAAAWLAKAALKHLANRDIERFRQDLTMAGARELETLRSSLSQAATEHSATFTSLQARRAEVVSRLYSLVAETEDAVELFLDPRRAAKPEVVKPLYEGAFDKLRELRTYYRANRIFLTDGTCAKLDGLFDAIHRPAWSASFDVYMQSTSDEDRREEHRVRREAWSSFRDGVEPLKRDIEAEFRRILGVVPALPSTPPRADV
jgi:hypothetical protein